MTRLVAELVAAHAGHGEGVDLIEPGVDGFPPVGAHVARVEGLIKILAHFESLHGSAVCAVVPGKLT